MKKFINSVDTMLAESLDGFVAAHAAIVALGRSANSCFGARRPPKKSL
jgi:phosphoenolpyruvate---glycerone phosphotransferase subunit DhaK